MIKPTEETHSVEEKEKTQAVVQQVTAAFRQVEEFESFVKGLEAALNQTEFFERAAISLYPRLQESEAESGKRFPGGALSLPLAAGDKVHGLVGFTKKRHPFGPQDLHLMASLGELLSVLVEHAIRVGDQRRNLALLGFLLDQAPVGAVCFDGERNLLVSNGLGRRWLGLSGAGGQRWMLPEAWADQVKAAAAGSGAFHCNVGGKLLHAEVTQAPADGEEFFALVLADLTPEQEKFQEAVAREVYRCGWLDRPVSLALISTAAPGPLMATLAPLKERLGRTALVAPAEADVIGILFADTSYPQCMGKLREIRPLLEDDWQLGLAVSEKKNPDPEALFAAAAGSFRKVGDLLKHTLLLHDDYPSVNDMLEMVLRDRFGIVKSHDFDVTIRHLRTGRFDGFFSEIDLSNGASARDLIRVAKEANPRVRPFFTSCAAPARREDPLFRKEIVFQKPFDVREVLTQVRAAFDG